MCVRHRVSLVLLGSDPGALPVTVLYQMIYMNIIHSKKERVMIEMYVQFD